MKFRVFMTVEIEGSTPIGPTEVDDMMSGTLEALITAGGELGKEFAKMVAFDILEIEEVEGYNHSKV